jgi:hypothetical protein
MNDTTPEIENKLNQIYLSKSGEEKLLIALQMFETAKKIVISSMPKNLSDSDFRRELFLRFYGDDFSKKERENILSHF